MNNALFQFAHPANEPVKEYRPGSPERVALEKELQKQSNEVVEIPIIIGGKEIRTGDMGEVVMPHNHKHVIAKYHKVGEKEVNMAIEAALKAKKDWENTPWVERASIMAKIGQLLATKYRARINAACMLGQSKNAFQAEIDSACETIDFYRFNNYYAGNLYSEQPSSTPDQLNRVEYRPLEGFIMAVTPFNFTSIASNLNMTPALMGNTTIWKPSTTALLSNYHIMQIAMEAGLPAGVVNFLPGKGSLIGGVALNNPNLAGIHFTGSTATFQGLWKGVGVNIANYKSYPRLVGETGGKDFIFAHSSANPREVACAIVRGAFEYQGQKCSAASRAYIPASMWNEVKQIVSALSRWATSQTSPTTSTLSSMRLHSTTARATSTEQKPAKTLKSCSAASATRASVTSSSLQSYSPRCRTTSQWLRRSSDLSSPSTCTTTRNMRKHWNSATRRHLTH